MKIFYTIILLLYCSTLFSQNWNLINNDSEYHYAINGEYNTTVKVDSFDVNWVDTTFYLNRIVSACDSCINAGSEEYLLYNQPIFLQREVLKQGNDFIFNDTSNFIIKTDLQLNDTWIFDVSNSINAEVFSVDEELIFGILDSTKTILLSTNDTIKISKRFGIMQFEDYQLIGVIKGNNVFGFKLPKFLGFYNFEVGDVFQYEEKSTSWSNMVDDLDTYKYTILSKNLGPNSIEYSVHHQRKSESLYFNIDWGGKDEIIDLIFMNFDNNLSNSFNSSLILTEYQDDNYFSKAGFAYNDDGLKLKYYGNGSNPPLWSTFYETVSDSSNLLFNSTETADRYYEEITEGLGLTFIDFNDFEAWGYTKLIGYIKSGVQTGIVHGDGFYTSVLNLNKDLMSISPNPVKDKLQLDLNEFQKKIKIEISNTLGKVVSSKIFSNQKNMEMDLSLFSKGIYFLKIETDDSYAVQKIIKD